MGRLCFLAAFALLGLPGAPGAATTYVIDNDAGAPGYTSSGTWTLSSSTGYAGGHYWYSHHTYPPSSATWTPNLEEAGRYDVFAVLRTGSNRTDDAPFTIVHASGTTIVHVTMLGANEVKDILLGTFEFQAGTGGFVRLDNNGGDGYYISDAVKLVEFVDDPPEIAGPHHLPSYPLEPQPVAARVHLLDDVEISGATLSWLCSPSEEAGALPAWDDGLHGDGEAGDDLYGAWLPPQPKNERVVYRFRATDSAGQSVDSVTRAYVVGQSPRREYRSIWVDSWGEGILSAAQCEELIQTCREYHLNAVMVEIRKVGDAYYHSSLEPRATNIEGGEDFDPLGYLLELAHDTSEGKARIEVHGWFVMHRLSAGEPLDPQHVLARHPEYTMTSISGATESSSNSMYVDPGHPGAVDHNVAVILDCLENYDLDGVNLDYIRYPGGLEWGYNAAGVERFNAFHDRSGIPPVDDAAWSAWRRECVTLEVKKVYVKSRLVAPDVLLSADTAPWGGTYDDFEHSTAYTWVFQDWVGWLDRGILDYNALMNYTRNAEYFLGWTRLSLAHDSKRGSIIGMKAYDKPTIQDAMNQLHTLRRLGAAGLNIYDWYSETLESGPARTTFYETLRTQLYEDRVEPPVAAWRNAPEFGIIEGSLSYEGEPVDHALVSVEGLPESQTRTDGSGWYALIELPPGSYRLRFARPGYPERTVWTALPSAGDIVTVNADLGDEEPHWQLR